MKEKKSKNSKINEYNTDFLKSSEKHNFCINHTMNNKEYERQIKEFYKDIRKDTDEHKIHHQRNNIGVHIMEGNREDNKWQSR